MNDRYVVDLHEAVAAVRSIRTLATDALVTMSDQERTEKLRYIVNVASQSEATLTTNSEVISQQQEENGNG